MEELKEEFKYICQKIITPADLANKDKKKKIRRKTIHIITGVEHELALKKQQSSIDLLVDKHLDTIEENNVNEIIEITTINPAKKQRKPRQSKKNAQLEVIEDV